MSAAPFFVSDPISIPGFRGSFAVLSLDSIACCESRRNDAILTTVRDEGIGLLQPIAVQECDRQHTKAYEVVSGRRRYWAFRDNGYEYIPAVIVPRDCKGRSLRTLTENFSRSDNFKDDIGALLDLLWQGGTVDGISERLGLRKRSLGRLARFLGLSPRALEALRGGSISVTGAQILAGLTRQQQDTYLLKESKYTVSSIKAFCRDAQCKPEQMDIFGKSGLEGSR